MQARYQYGNLTIRKRKKGPDTWQFRWTEKGRLRSVLIGTVDQLPTRDDALRATEFLRLKINTRNPQQPFHSVTVGGLIDRFMEEYVPRHCRRLTQKTYRSFFENHIRPRWGEELLEDVRPAHVQQWLDDYPASRQIKSYVKNLMRTLFQRAIWWEMIDRNPLAQIREPRKRLKQPRVINAEQFRALLAELKEPFRTMAVAAGCLGLRVSELIGLKWSDFDFEQMTLTIHRSVVEGEINETKTDASESTLPLDFGLARVFLAEKARQNGSGSNGWVFGNANRSPALARFNPGQAA